MFFFEVFGDMLINYLAKKNEKVIQGYKLFKVDARQASLG